MLLLFGVGISLIAAMGLAQRLGWITSGGGGATSSEGAEAGTIYTCPMHPQIRQPNPGNCPICGMTLVPATSSGGADLDELAVKIEPAARRLANIETLTVTREPVYTIIETIGAVAIDESRIATIPSYIDGRIEKLFADYTGVVVEKGDHLAIIYTPELYSAQVEYLESLKAVSGGDGSSLATVRKALEKLATNSRQRLVELGMTDEQIQDLEQSQNAKSRLTIYATSGGTVIEKMALEGKYVKAGEPIYRIADLSTIWLMLELYPEDAARIRFGQRVEAEMQSLPGEIFEGRVAFIDPTVNDKDRTVGVRVEFLNEQGLMRPGDYASARIHLPIGQRGEIYDAALAGKWISPMHPQIIQNKPGKCPICGMDLVPTSRYGYSEKPVEHPPSLVVPRSAVLMAGSHSVVYVETEPGRFEIRVVTLGPILKDQIVIQDGLQEGEKVAVAGNFLIDSQMQLAGKPSLIDPTRAILAQKERKKPLEFDKIDVQVLSGDPGKQLEQLYAAYFVIQQALAVDRKPSESEAGALHTAAMALLKTDALPAEVKDDIQLIAKKSEHLHHMELEPARLKAFRPISHAVVRLASKVRGEGASNAFSQMFCPMVPGGAGDWLQLNDKLHNPYFGSKMPTCGDVVRQFPLSGPPQNSSGKRTPSDKSDAGHSQHQHSEEKE